MEIGGLPNISNSIDFIGLVDDFAFFDTVLTQPEIDAIFNGNLSGVVNGNITPLPETAWRVDKSGSWHNRGNWTNNLPDPASGRFTAIFDDAINSPRVVTTETDVTIRAILFDHDVSYAISGHGIGQCCRRLQRQSSSGKGKAPISSTRKTA